jgi:hypothetical protein
MQMTKVVHKPHVRFDCVVLLWCTDAKTQKNLVFLCVPTPSSTPFLVDRIYGFGRHQLVKQPSTINTRFTNLLVRSPALSACTSKIGTV